MTSGSCRTAASESCIDDIIVKPRVCCTLDVRRTYTPVCRLYKVFQKSRFGMSEFPIIIIINSCMHIYTRSSKVIEREENGLGFDIFSILWLGANFALWL